MSDQDKAAVWKENVEALHRAQRANLLQRERIEQLEAALRELVEAQEALELALLDGRSGEHDFGALNGRVINAWDKARALIGKA